MRRFLIVAITIAILLGILGGCGKQKAAEDSTTWTSGSGISAETALENIEKIIAESDLADFYSVTQLPASEVPNSKEMLYTVLIRDNLQEETTYHMRFRADSVGEVYAANMMRSGKNDMAHTLFSFYMVSALGIDVDIVELTDALGTMNATPSGSFSVAGWNLQALTLPDGTIDITALFKAE